MNKQFFFTFLLTDQLPSFGSDDGEIKCIATTSCDGEKFTRGYKKCDHVNNKYYVICGKKH